MLIYDRSLIATMNKKVVTSFLRFFDLALSAAQKIAQEIEVD